MEKMIELAFQIALIIFAVRIFGKLSKLVGIPSVLGELIAGIVIGPFALGGISIPGFENGLFPLESVEAAGGSLPALYAIAQIAAIILLFSSGLETDLGLFIKYSVSGGIIGIGGVVASFVLGDVAAMFIIKYLGGEGTPLPSFMDVKCLFLGVMSTATSVGITARILSDKKKMDSPEGVTILAAAVFDDVLGIVLLAVINGIAAASVGVAGGSAGEGLSVSAIGIIAAKAIGIWLIATVVFVVMSKKIAKFVRLFGGTYDFSIAAFGVALVLAGIFEMNGLAMIIGAYTTGLALSKTDIAPVIQERIHGLYKFFVPIFFAVTGMSVDVTKLCNGPIIVCGLIFTVVGVLSKLIGCGGPALFLGFNLKGGFRIGAGMIPRGEVALIIAGIGLGAGIVDQSLFGIVIMMTLLTTLMAPPVLNISLGLKGRGTRKEVTLSEAQSFEWDFHDTQIATLVMDMFVRDLRSEGFFVQTMSITDGLFQARKGEIVLSGRIEETNLIFETSERDMGFIKGEIYEVMLRLKKSMESLNALHNTTQLQFGFVSSENRVENVLFRHLDKNCISVELKSDTKEGIVEELVDMLDKAGKLTNRFEVLKCVMEREKSMSTGLGNGIAIPHAKCDFVKQTCLAIGIKVEGMDYKSLDGKPSHIFVLLVSPNEGNAPQMRLMSAMTGALMHEDVRQRLLVAKTPEEVIKILKETKE